MVPLLLLLLLAELPQLKHTRVFDLNSPTADTFIANTSSCLVLVSFVCLLSLVPRRSRDLDVSRTTSKKVLRPPPVSLEQPALIHAPD